jgi:hypothetical protein
MTTDAECILIERPKCLREMQGPSYAYHLTGQAAERPAHRHIDTAMHENTTPKREQRRDNFEPEAADAVRGQ